jgi:hypothetical protein
MIQSVLFVHMSWPYRLRVLAILALFAVISATEAA